MNRGRRGEAVFQSKDDYQRFIDILYEAIELFSLRISAYCLMTERKLSRNVESTKKTIMTLFDSANLLIAKIKSLFNRILALQNDYLREKTKSCAASWGNTWCRLFFHNVYIQ
jgi:hypothetical protein